MRKVSIQEREYKGETIYHVFVDIEEGEDNFTVEAKMKTEAEAKRLGEVLKVLNFHTFQLDQPKKEGGEA
jgi:hypothetical protein